MVMRFTREGWPEKKDSDDPAEKIRKIADSLSVCHGCLLYGARVVIPNKLRRQVLDLLHECHFGIQRNEAVGKDSRLLAEHRFRHSRSMPAMFDLRQASV